MEALAEDELQELNAQHSRYGCARNRHHSQALPATATPRTIGDGWIKTGFCSVMLEIRSTEPAVIEASSVGR